ncbi:hypothetical protein ACOSQ3_032015 [Xanthoceras sorbifolium]
MQSITTAASDSNDFGTNPELAANLILRRMATPSPIKGEYQADKCCNEEPSTVQTWFRMMMLVPISPLSASTAASVFILQQSTTGGYQ